MKRAWMYLAAVALFAFSGSAQAVPSVNLNGNLYLAMPGYSSTTCQVAKLPFTTGVAGALNAGFFSTANNGDMDDLGNFDLYNHNPYVLVHTTNGYAPNVWKVDGTTGVGTQVLVNDDCGYRQSFAVDHSTGDIYITDSTYSRVFQFHDGNANGNYNDAGEKTTLYGPYNWTLFAYNPGGWPETDQRQDAQFYNGWLYFTSGGVELTKGISRLQAAPSLAYNVAADETNSVPGWSGTVIGPRFLALGDPNGNGEVDLYAQVGTTSVGSFSNVLMHWEDKNGDGIFTADELSGSVSLGAGARDVELVTDGTHSMIIYLDSSMNVKYVNLFDNGLIDAANTGTLFTTGLAPSNTTYVYLKMDQVAAAVPEPATLALLGTGVLGALGWMRRRKLK